MSDLAERIEEVESAARGPEIGAFFDFDGTLIAVCISRSTSAPRSWTSPTARRVRTSTG